MTDYRRLVTKRSALALAAMALAALVACGGAPPESEMAAVAEPEGTSDLVVRPLPNPTAEVITQWADLPDGRTWGSTAGIDIGPDGHIWTYDRCGGVALEGGCEANPTVDPILKFDRDTGEVLASFGAGLFVLPVLATCPVHPHNKGFRLRAVSLC